MELSKVANDDSEHIKGMLRNEFHFDWSGLAFDSKKPLSALNATFIAAPRKMSQARLKQLIKNYLPKGNIVIGIANEQYVEGLGPNPAFTMLKRMDVEELLLKVNAASPKFKLYTLAYFQRDFDYILQKIKFKQVVLVRGSWHKTFHLSAAYFTLAQNHTKFVYVSPYADEDEAIEAAQAIDDELSALYSQPQDGTYSEDQLMTLADIAACRSLDYSFQTGAVLAKKTGKKYRLIDSAFNKVVPYQTYAMHHGNSREDNFSPPNDLNHYDAVHAEMMLMIQAATNGADLKDTSLFINLMPCPTCARALSQTPIQEIVYREDHSKGYGIQLLTNAGKSVRRLV